MKLNLSKIQKKGEDDHFFHLNDGKSDFKVAKAGLAKTTHDAIVQHFDEGSEDAEGNPDVVHQSSEAAAPSDDEVMNSPSIWAPVTAAAPKSQDIQDILASPSQQPATGGSGPAETAIAGAPKPAPISAGAGIGGTSKDEKDLEAANKQAVDAEKKRADIATRQAADDVRIQQEMELKRQAKAAEIDRQYADVQARGDQLSDDIASSKIDPNHFWGSKSTGQKVGSVIALLLGGIGGGLNRTNHNVVMDMMQKQMSDDVDAQKADLGKKESLLSHYMQQGHSLQQAKQLAMADMNDALRGQLALSSAKFGGENAAAISESNQAILGQNAVKLRMATKLEHLKMAEGQGTLEMQGLQRKAMREQAAMAPFQQDIARRFETEGITPEEGTLLGPKDRERSVYTAEGKMRGLGSEKEATKYKEEIQPVTQLNLAVNRYKKMFETGEGENILKRGERKSVESVRNAIISQLSHLYDQKRLNDHEFKMFSAQVPELDQFFRPGAKGAIESLQQLIADKKQAMNQTYFGPGRRDAKGLVIE